MKYLLLVLLLTGCSTTVPVTSKFPEPPKYSLQSCPQLQLLKEGSKLSDVATTVTINYSTVIKLMDNFRYKTIKLVLTMFDVLLSEV